MIDLKQQELRTIRTILEQWVPCNKVVAFGSRVTGLAKPFSDIDLAIYSSEPLPPQIMAHLRDAFSASSLPIKVDLVETATVDKKFLAIIENQAEVIQRG